LIEPTCVANKYSISIVVGKESLYTEALTETENVLRNAKAHREFWEGRLSWIENLRKQFEDVTTPSEDGELNATEDMYGNYEIISKAIGTASKAASVLKVVAETGTEEQRKVCLAAEATLTNEKAKGYWKELEVAIKNADSQAIVAAATKLKSETDRMDIEHKYGVKMTAKQWIELGIGVTGAVAGTIGAGALVKNGMTAAKEAAKKTQREKYNNYINKKLRRTWTIQGRVIHDDNQSQRIVF
jgi:hypothetical protein